MAGSTQRDVAREARVSQYTVSLALRGDPEIPLQTRQRVLKAAHKLGYRLDPLLSAAMSRIHQPKSAGRGAVGLLWRGVRPATLNQRCLEALQQQVESTGYRLDLIEVRGGVKDWERTIEIVNARGLEGLFLWEWRQLVWEGPGEGEFLRRSLPLIPIVSLGGHEPLPFPTWSVGPDRTYAGYHTILQCLARGYRRPGILGSTETAWNIRSSYLAGVLMAIHSLVDPRDRIPMLTVATPGIERELQAWLDTCHPDVVITLKGLNSLPEFLRQGALSQSDRSGPGLVLWETNQSNEWAGFDPEWERIARTAADAMFGAISHHNLSRPPAPAKLLVQGTWHIGGSLPYRLATTASDTNTRSISLKKQVNRPVEGGDDFWFNNRHSLAGLNLNAPIGVGGVPFHLTPFPRTKIAGALILAAPQTGSDLPAEVVIPINRRATQLAFLHACAFAENWKTIGEYTIQLRDGDQYRIPLVSLGTQTKPDRQSRLRPNLQDWWPSFPTLPDRILVTHPDDPTYVRYLYRLVWTNPRPGTTIQSLRIRMRPRTKTRLALLALTLVKSFDGSPG